MIMTFIAVATNPIAIYIHMYLTVLTISRLLLLALFLHDLIYHPVIKTNCDMPDTSIVPVFIEHVINSNTQIILLAN